MVRQEVAKVDLEIRCGSEGAKIRLLPSRLIWISGTRQNPSREVLDASNLVAREDYA